MKDEMDILKEVGTTAAAHGSIALSEILGRKINLKLPSLEVLPWQQVAKEINIQGMVITMQTQMMGGIHGKLVFVLEEKSSFKLIDLCYKKQGEYKKTGLFTEIGMSVIKEVGNIIISSYISSLSLFTRKLIIPTFPILMNAPISEVIANITANSEENYFILIQAIFEETTQDLKGNFWLILTSEAAEEIKKICKQMLKDI